MFFFWFWMTSYFPVTQWSNWQWQRIWIGNRHKKDWEDVLNRQSSASRPGLDSLVQTAWRLDNPPGHGNSHWSNKSSKGPITNPPTLMTYQPLWQFTKLTELWEYNYSTVKYWQTHLPSPSMSSSHSSPSPSWSVSLCEGLSTVLQLSHASPWRSLSLFLWSTLGTSQQLSWDRKWGLLAKQGA